MKVILTILATGVLLMYPFAVYFGLHFFSPQILGVILLVFLLVRIMLLKNNKNKLPWLIPATVMGATAIVSSSLTNSIIGFKLYPLMINGSMLIVFAYSYFKPPTVIETFARLTDKNLSPEAIKYTANVTLIWCLFFIVNGLISLYTAIYSSLDVWMFYNGFLSYIAMGLLMAVEYLIRLKVKKNHSSVKKEQTLGVDSNEQ